MWQVLEDALREAFARREVAARRVELPVVEGDEPFGLSEFVLSGFVRIATHPRVFDPPAPLAEALAFADALRSQPNAVIIAPGTRHWEILASDAYLAALAIESGCEWITADRDFSRFPRLRWRHPLAVA